MLSGYVKIEFRNIVGLANRNMRFMLVPDCEKLQKLWSSKPEDKFISCLSVFQ